MIPAVRLGDKVFRMGLEQLLQLAGPFARDFIAQPGSQKLELQIATKLRAPELWPDLPVLDPRQWEGDPRGFIVRQIIEGMQRHEHLLRVARNLTPEQQAALWQDPSEQAAALRRVMKLDAARARAAG
jgi:hypothetical protein